MKNALFIEQMIEPYVGVNNYLTRTYGEFNQIFNAHAESLQEAARGIFLKEFRIIKRAYGRRWEDRSSYLAEWQVPREVCIIGLSDIQTL